MPRILVYLLAAKTIILTSTITRAEFHIPSWFGSQSGVTKAQQRVPHASEGCPLPESVNIAVVAAGFEPWPGNADVIRSGKALGSGSEGILAEFADLLKSVLLSTRAPVTFYGLLCNLLFDHRKNTQKTTSSSFYQFSAIVDYSK